LSGVAFWICAWRLAAPEAGCALAAIAIVPSMSAAAVNVIVSFRIKPSSSFCVFRIEQKYYGAATTQRTVPSSKSTFHLVSCTAAIKDKVLQRSDSATEFIAGIGDAAFRTDPLPVFE
jgi:hypothetical protein